MKKIIVLLLVLIIGSTFIACSNPTPKEPIIKGVEDGKVYGKPISITLDKKEEDVEYKATIDGEEYELGEIYEEEGKHTLVVTATREDKSIESKVNFEIDTVPPEVPTVKGIEKNEMYFQKVSINVEKTDGVTYKATIDGEDYEIGTPYKKDGEHIFKVTATKDKNNLSVDKKIPFTIDSTTYTEKEVDYFTEISLGAEYGGSPYVKKWLSDVKIKIGGNPTEDDLERVQKIVDELNSMISTIELSIVEDDENINMYFVPQGDFDEYIPSVRPGNWAYFSYYTKERWEINKAIITIGTFGSTQEDRNHFIIEELTQALGMGNDSPKYKDSIFYETNGYDSQSNEDFSELDRKVIEILYRRDVEVGMDKEEVLSVLEKRIVTE